MFSKASLGTMPNYCSKKHGVAYTSLIIFRLCICPSTQPEGRALILQPTICTLLIEGRKLCEGRRPVALKVEPQPMEECDRDEILSNWTKC